LGQLTALKTLKLSDCSALRRLPLSFFFLPDGIALSLKHHCLVFPPVDVVDVDDIQAIKTFLYANHHPLKILLLILAARRRRVRHPPPEIWNLLADEFFG